MAAAPISSLVDYTYCVSAWTSDGVAAANWLHFALSDEALKVAQRCKQGVYWVEYVRGLKRFIAMGGWGKTAQRLGVYTGRSDGWDYFVQGTDKRKLIRPLQHIVSPDKTPIVAVQLGFQLLQQFSRDNPGKVKFVVSFSSCGPLPDEPRKLIGGVEALDIVAQRTTLTLGGFNVLPGGYANRAILVRSVLLNPPPTYELEPDGSSPPGLPPPGQLIMARQALERVGGEIDAAIATAQTSPTLPRPDRGLAGGTRNKAKAAQRVFDKSYIRNGASADLAATTKLLYQRSSASHNPSYDLLTEEGRRLVEPYTDAPFFHSLCDVVAFRLRGGKTRSLPVNIITYDSIRKGAIVKLHAGSKHDKMYATFKVCMYAIFADSRRARSAVWEFYLDYPPGSTFVLLWDDETETLSIKNHDGETPAWIATGIGQCRRPRTGSLAAFEFLGASDGGQAQAVSRVGGDARVALEGRQ